MVKWWIIKNIFKVHILFYFVAFLCFITGQFKSFIIFTLIILFHELGHILTAIYYKWTIEKVIILPFGGITIFKEKLNRPIKEEFIIAISGSIFQTFLFLIIKDQTFINYSLFLLCFNLLPIIPLDGSKIINLICNKIFPFKKSYVVTIYISILTILLIFKLKVSFIILIILMFLILEIIKQYQKIDYYFNRFLLERYLYKFSFKKQKTIKNINNFYREHRHLIYIDKKYYTEHEILLKMFDKSRKKC